MPFGFEDTYVAPVAEHTVVHAETLFPPHHEVGYHEAVHRDIDASQHGAAIAVHEVFPHEVATIGVDAPKYEKLDG